MELTIEVKQRDGILFFYLNTRSLMARFIYEHSYKYIDTYILILLPRLMWHTLVFISYSSFISSNMPIL